MGSIGDPERLGAVTSGHGGDVNVKNIRNRDSPCMPLLGEGNRRRFNAEEARDETNKDWTQWSPGLAREDIAKRIALYRRPLFIHIDRSGPVTVQHFSWARKRDDEYGVQIVEVGLSI